MCYCDALAIGLLIVTVWLNHGRCRITNGVQYIWPKEDNKQTPHDQKTQNPKVLGASAYESGLSIVLLLMATIVSYNIQDKKCSRWI